MEIRYNVPKVILLMGFLSVLLSIVSVMLFAPDVMSKYVLLVVLGGLLVGLILIWKN